MRLIICLAITMIAAPALNAGAQTSTSPSQESVINHLQVTNTPVANAIQLASELGRVTIFVDRKTIAAAGLRLDQPVTRTFRNAPVSQILKELLPQGVSSTTQGDSFVVSTDARIATGNPFVLPRGKSAPTADLISIDRMASDHLFDQVFPIHADQMPLEMTVQMVAGMTGKHVRFDETAASQRWTRVSMHRDNSTIRQNLDDLLQAAGLQWEIDGHVLIIRGESG